MDFTGKVALVTGSSRGIGREVVMKLASLGCDVVVHYCHNEKKGHEVVQEIKCRFGREALLIQGDVGIVDDVVRMVDEVIQHYGRLDILVNNAGISIDQEFLEKDANTFCKVLDVNLLGPFLLCQKFAPYLIECGGVVVNVGSTNGIDTGYVQSMDYDASKAGLISLTHNLAHFFAPSVRVNMVAPGWVDTDMNCDMDPLFRKSEEDHILLSRFARASEVASVIVFLANDMASYVHDAVIRVDGGVERV